MSGIELRLDAEIRKDLGCGDYAPTPDPIPVCSPVTITDGLDVVEVASGGIYTCSAQAPCEDAVAVLKNTDGTIISTTSIAAGVTVDITALDGVVENSDLSFTANVPSDTTQPLSDIRIRRSDLSNIEFYPSNKNYTVADTQIDIYVNAVFDQTVNVMASTNETINITP